MATAQVERKLAAIFAADIAGYSRLMAADEVGTVVKLKASRVIIDRLIALHRGRIFNTTGDSVVADFASAVDAVQCAVAVQAALTEAAVKQDGNERLAFRIGVHVGDVIVDGSNLLGDGVNIAARLEAMAEPGGICVSARVQEDTAGKLDLAFEDLGEQTLRNIARPIRIYSLASTATAALLKPPAPATGVPRLSIVVLPFTNLSNDPEQEYLADAVTEDLTTDLSRNIVGLFVIARGTAFTYKGKQVDPKAVSRELGVRYALRGSVRRLDARVRITAQLIDCETAAHVWVDRYDRAAADLFVVQDEITSRIAVALNQALTFAEASRPTENPEALDYFLRGRAAMMRQSHSREDFADATALFERALALDPHSIKTRAYLAISLASRAHEDKTDTPTSDLERAAELVAGALATSSYDPLAHHAKGVLLAVQGQYEAAISEFEIALAADPNWVPTLGWVGWCRFWTGDIKAGMTTFEQLMCLSPRDENLGVWQFRIGLGHLLLSHVEEAIPLLERARSAGPTTQWGRIPLAAAYGLAGDTERAAAELAEARKHYPARRFSNITEYRAAGWFSRYPGFWGPPHMRVLFEATFFRGLRNAGMPEG